MGKRKAEDDEWELYKDEIVSLRKIHTVSEVRSLMCKRGFKRSIAQYDRRLNTWKDGAPKNVKGNEWRYIFQKTKQRAEEGKSSAVTVRGYQVPQSRIDKQSRKHTYQTALQRYAPEVPATTPPSVEVYTPRDHSPPFNLAQSGRGLSTLPKLPWRRFSDQLYRVVDSYSAAPPLSSLHYMKISSPNSTQRRKLPFEALIEAPSAVDNHSFGFDDSITPVECSAAALSTLRNYLPLDSITTIQHDEDIGYDLTVKGTQLQMLEYAVGLMANGHQIQSLRENTMTLFDDQKNLAFLQRLLTLNQTSTNVFTEKLLLWTVVNTSNSGLLKTLLSAGANPNYEDSWGRSLLASACCSGKTALCKLLLEFGAQVNHKDSYGKTPLIQALNNDYDDLVDLLLAYGANVNFQDDDRISPLTMAVGICGDNVLSKLLEKGADFGNDLPLLLEIVKNHSCSITERLIQRVHTSTAYCPCMWTRAFIHAARETDLDTLIKLASLQPHHFEELRKTPWLLFEAVAFDSRGIFDSTIAIIKYLGNNGFDITKTDESGRGSPLVYAALEGNVDLIKYLLEAGARVDIFANGDWVTWDAKPRTRIDLRILLSIEELVDYDNLLYNLLRHETKKIAPIHGVAMCDARDKEEVMRLLLNYGADPNQFGAAYPIQLASYTCRDNTACVEALLSAGADPNLTSPRKPEFQYHESSRYWQEHACFLLSNSLQMALHEGSPALFEILRAAGAQLPEPSFAMEYCTCKLRDNASAIALELEEISLTALPPRLFRVKQSSLLQQLHQGDGLAENDRLSNSNINDNRQKDDPESCGVATHDCDNRMCPLSRFSWWNPLTRIIYQYYRDTYCEALFFAMLEIMSPAHKKRWLTKTCLSGIAKHFKWESIIRLIQDGTILAKDGIILSRAVYEDEQWAHELIKGGVPKDHGRRGFVHAAKLRHNALVETFLASGYWPNIKVKIDYYPEFEGCDTRHFCSPLSQALSTGNHELISIFRRFYSAKFSVRSTLDCSSHFAQAYGEAIRYGEIAMAEVLMQPGRPSDVQYSGPVPAFGRHRIIHIYSSVQLAYALEQYDMAQWLLAEGAEPNITEERQQSSRAYHSPLQCASSHGDTVMVISLLKYGADVNGMPSKIAGATALQFAAMLGNFELLEILLEAGASVNAPPSRWEGRSAIEGAAECGRLDTVFLLLEAGADIQGKTNVNYRRTVYRALVHGHRVLAEAIQQWKKEKYGPEDCESTDTIIESMDMETLGHLWGELDYMKVLGNSCVVCQRHLGAKRTQDEDGETSSWEDEDDTDCSSDYDMD